MVTSDFWSQSKIHLKEAQTKIYLQEYKNEIIERLKETLNIKSLSDTAYHAF